MGTFANACGCGSSLGLSGGSHAMGTLVNFVGSLFSLTSRDRSFSSVSTEAPGQESSSSRRSSTSGSNNAPNMNIVGRKNAKTGANNRRDAVSINEKTEKRAV